MKSLKKLILINCIILGTFSHGLTQAEIEFNSSGVSPHLDLIETGDNDWSRIFFRNLNANSDKWALSGKLGTDSNEHLFGLYYNSAKRLVYDEPSRQFQIDGYQKINSLVSDENMILTSNNISVKNEDDITLFQLGDLPFGGYEGELRLNSADGLTQKSGIFMKADDTEGGEISLYNSNGITRAFIKAGLDFEKQSRLHLEGVSENMLANDGIARHLIALVNDKSSIGLTDDKQFYIGVWEDVVQTAPVVTEEAISIAFQTGGIEPTNTDIIAKIDQFGNYETISDLRLKDNIRSLDGVLDKVLSLSPSTYHFKRDATKQNQIGFIAQDMEKYFPALAAGDGSTEGQFMTVNYQGMIPVLTKAIQEQNEIITDLHAEMKLLKDQLAETALLKKQMAKLSTDLASLVKKK